MRLVTAAMAAPITMGDGRYPSEVVWCSIKVTPSKSIMVRPLALLERSSIQLRRFGAKRRNSHVIRKSQLDHDGCLIKPTG